MIDTCLCVCAPACVRSFYVIEKVSSTPVYFVLPQKVCIMDFDFDVGIAKTKEALKYSKCWNEWKWQCDSFGYSLCFNFFFFFLDSITLPFQKNNQLIWVLITSQIKKQKKKICD